VLQSCALAGFFYEEALRTDPAVAQELSHALEAHFVRTVERSVQQKPFSFTCARLLEVAISRGAMADSCTSPVVTIMHRVFVSGLQHGHFDSRSLGRPNCNVTEQALALVGSWLAQSNSIESALVAHIAYNVSVSPLIQSLSSVTTLKRLDLDACYLSAELLVGYLSNSSVAAHLESLRYCRVASVMNDELHNVGEALWSLKQLRELELADVDNDLLESSALFAPGAFGGSLKRLVLQGSGPYASFRALERIFAACPHLESLSVASCDWSAEKRSPLEALGACNNTLRELHWLQGVELPGSDSIDFLCAHVAPSSVRCLELSNASSLSSEQWQCILRSPSHLTDLTVTYPGNSFDDAVLVALGEAAGKTLTRLSLLQCNNTTIAGWNSFLQHCSALEELSFGGLSVVDEKLIESLTSSASASTLRILDLRGCRRINPSCSFAYLQRCSRLCSLDVSCITLGGTVSAELLAALPWLEILRLDATEDEFHRMIEMCDPERTRWREVSVSGAAITDRTIALLATRLGAWLEHLRTNETTACTIAALPSLRQMVALRSLPELLLPRAAMHWLAFTMPSLRFVRS